MKIEVNKIFYGPIRKVSKQEGYTDVTSPGNSGIVSTLETVAVGLLYEINPNIFFDLITKNTYPASSIFSMSGDLVVKKQELTPIRALCKKLNIELPETVKTSSKELKLIKRVIIKESVDKVMVKTRKTQK